jgi:hypothetical protein
MGRRAVYKVLSIVRFKSVPGVRQGLMRDIIYSFNLVATWIYIDRFCMFFCSLTENLRLRTPRQWRNYYGLRPGEPGGPQPQWAKCGPPGSGCREKTLARASDMSQCRFLTIRIL